MPPEQLFPEHFVAHQENGVQAFIAAFFFAANVGVAIIETVIAAIVPARTNLAIDFIMVFSP